MVFIVSYFISTYCNFNFFAYFNQTLRNCFRLQLLLLTLFGFTVLLYVKCKVKLFLVYENFVFRFYCCPWPVYKYMKSYHLIHVYKVQILFHILFIFIIDNYSTYVFKIIQILLIYFASSYFCRYNTFMYLKYMCSIANFHKLCYIKRQHIANIIRTAKNYFSLSCSLPVFKLFQSPIKIS